MRAASLAIALLCVSGCGEEDRKPIPIVQLVVRDEPGAYDVDGKRVWRSELPGALQAIVDENRRAKGGTIRARVRVQHSSRVAAERVQDVVSQCASVGLVQVTVEVRETQPTGK